MTDDEWDREKTLGTFLDNPAEVHAWWLGMCTAFRHLRPGTIPEDYSEANRQEIEAEYPYYLGGFYVARVMQVVGATFLAYWGVVL